jgi:hypothetical protein
VTAARLQNYSVRASVAQFRVTATLTARRALARLLHNWRVTQGEH